MTPDKVLIPERYLDVEDNTPLSPEEQKEKQKKLERIKTLIAKSKWVTFIGTSHMFEPIPIGPIKHALNAPSFTTKHAETVPCMSLVRKEYVTHCNSGALLRLQLLTF